MPIVNKVLITQLVRMYKSQGPLKLSFYLATVFNYRFVNHYFRGSYSQKGEDLFIDKYFKHKKRGFYIDIGACHPERFNNTKFFYDRGWHGINIEPIPSRITLFENSRKRDINLNVGIGTKEQKMTFYEFQAAAFSTFSKKEADSLLHYNYKLKQKIRISILRLEKVMKKYVKGSVDFMAVDTEGFDLDVLKSNNWKKYRPKLLCVETIDFIQLLNTGKDSFTRRASISRFLRTCGYREYFSNGLNTFYKDSQ